jgi:FAD:protein FMN transferase
MAVVERRGRVMASSLHLLAVGAHVEELDRALAGVTDHLQHLEQCWSRFIPTSDVTCINRLGRSGGGSLTVDPSTVRLIATMVEGYQCTAGRFDPTVLPWLIAAGYSASRVDPTLTVELPAPAAAWPLASLHDVEFDPTTNTVTVPPGLTLDPGGIGKGLAADLAVGRLLAAGASGAMVEIGGDLAMAGTPVDPAGWLVNVERPDPADGMLCSLAISGGGVATSSTRSRRWAVDGVQHHHQIDPVTEASSTTDLDAVTVIAPTGWSAEVHATAALAAGSAGALAYLDGHGLSGIAVVKDGSVLMTADLAAVALIEARAGVGVR